MAATEKILNEEEISSEEQSGFEALVLPGKRPVLDIIDGDISPRHLLTVTHIFETAHEREHVTRTLLLAILPA